MFEPSPTPRAFALPLGVDVPAEIVAGLTARLGADAPEDWARVELMVNTRRMARRIRAIFDAGPARLLPRLSLVTDPGLSWDLADLPPAVPSLRRRLELVQLIRALLDREPRLAARAALFDLATSLAALMDEMQGEGVSADTIAGLDVSDMSGHWARALKFIAIARGFLATTDGTMDAAGRQRLAVERRIAAWHANPPQHPVIVAGSTGSRGTTLMLMEAVARLPQGALILPGYDFDQPAQVWDGMDDALTAEDHPQYRFRRLMDGLGIGPADIHPWSDTSPPSPARNRLVSLALRPAPVTHAWLTEGPALQGLTDGLKDVTLLEAPSPRAEALAIAMRLRQAAEDGIRAALITPDRMLTRQVAAALARWEITPDDSAGMPLQLSPPGRFLRQVASLFVRPMTGAALIALLKHPLTHSGEGRGIHLLLTRDLELHLRRYGPAFPDAAALVRWAEKQADRRGIWVEWLTDTLCGLDDRAEDTLEGWTERLLSVAERVAGGPAEGSGGLWERNAGIKARSVLDLLQAEAPAGGDLTATEFADLLGALLSGEEVRDRDAAHPGIMIWGTLEARVMGADLLILGGLNEGSWPEAPAPDPWLNRQMRKDAGLLLPERRIGLAAHDFQQAIGAAEVWLTRAVRSEDADTVPSRWLNRLTNLLGGLRDTEGPALLAEMQKRGKYWLELAEELERPLPTPAAPRPAPRPPLDARPRHYRVTEIRTLIRDPYAIYARKVLGLQPLDPLMQEADAADRGTLIHKVFERFIKDAGPDDLTPERLLECADRELADLPWPAARRLWRAKLARITNDFIAGEKERQKRGIPTGFEVKAEDEIAPHGVSLTGRADRLDRTDDGRIVLYDYKTGHVPTEAEQKGFDKQLLIEAAMAERGAFEDFPPTPVAGASYLGVGTQAKTVEAPLADMPPAEVWADLGKLMAAYLDLSQGFAARRAMRKDTDVSDYDHLSRFGEWDVTAPSNPEDVG
ncbi:double-strand break repair protein AddB [Chachezhania sediminis]|uniref:double-strand break repair protein AddB n=1 Tax=Chachezhania sediminis TaxID=2599291 RepID=UPI00131AC665|nr:double-strand break repair protein AddB [Chachezhania sediminis]